MYKPLRARADMDQHRAHATREGRLLARVYRSKLDFSYNSRWAHSKRLNARGAVLPSRLGSDDHSGSWPADGSIDAENFQRGQRAASNKNSMLVLHDTVRLCVIRSMIGQL